MVTYLRAKDLKRSFFALSLTINGFVFAYSDINSLCDIVLSLISILQGPGMATMSLGYVLQPPSEKYGLTLSSFITGEIDTEMAIVNIFIVISIYL